MFDFDGSYWLCNSEQEETISRLVSAGLIKWDNNRSLPLKSGGKTDIYINLRMMRSHPYVMKYLGELYANPLRRLRVNRFVEVPEAVSLLAGVVSVASDIPAVTIREEEKEGRVVSGKFVGDLNAGDRVAIIDDVITDGKSKIPALNLLSSVAAEMAGIVVLVDRQQGWRKKLAQEGFGNTRVWAGMNLHDVRKFLVKEKLMQRCDPEVEKKNPLIIALDGKSWDDFLPILDQLRTTGCIFKANDLLFNEGIKHLASNLSVYGRVMADIKSHDIDNTVRNTLRHLRVCPPWGVTVHATGGPAMVTAAVQELAGTPTIVLAVTVLTSIDKDTCDEIYRRLPLDQVQTLANMAWKAGARGFVCSGQEASTLRALYPEAVIVVPALRSPKSGEEQAVKNDDQKRISTFQGAKSAGANYYVGGRQFLQAADPVAEVYRVLKDELDVKL